MAQGFLHGQGGLDTSDATATADDITIGLTAYVNGELVTGTNKNIGYSFLYTGSIGSPLVSSTTRPVSTDVVINRECKFLKNSTYSGKITFTLKTISNDGKPWWTMNLTSTDTTVSVTKTDSEDFSATGYGGTNYDTSLKYYFSCSNVSFTPTHTDAGYIYGIFTLTIHSYLYINNTTYSAYNSRETEFSFNYL